MEGAGKNGRCPNVDRVGKGRRGLVVGGECCRRGGREGKRPERVFAKIQLLPHFKVERLGDRRRVKLPSLRSGVSRYGLCGVSRRLCFYAIG